MATTATSSTLTAGASGTASEPSIESEPNSSVEALKDVSEHVDHAFEMAGLAYRDHLESGPAFSELVEEHGYAKAPIMGAVRMIGAALIGIAVLVVVLVEIFQLDAIANIDDGTAFSGIIDSLEGTGAAALGLLIIGLLVLAANRVMGFFGGGGF